MPAPTGHNPPGANAPLARNDATSTNEDTNILIDVMDNDLGGKGRSLYSVGNVTGGAIATIVGNQIQYDLNGAFQHLAQGQTAVETFEYAIRLGNGVTSTATATVTITGKNDDPTVSGPVTRSVDEDATGSVNLLANASDVDDGHVLSVTGMAWDDAATAGALPAGFTISGNSIDVDATSYDSLAEGQFATFDFSYNVVDEHGASVAQAATITINGKNDGPVSEADTASGKENQTLTIDVLANDTDIDDGAILTLVSGGAPEGEGSASVVGNKLVFEPGTDFDYLAANTHETVTLSYTMEDEHGAQSSSTVEVTITGENDTATISGGHAGFVKEDGVLTASGDLNISDADTGEDLFQVPESLVGKYGTFTFDAETGAWGYELDNDAPAVQALKGTDVVYDRLTVTSEDGTDAETIEVAINGTWDVQTITREVTLNQTSNGQFFSFSFNNLPLLAPNSGAKIVVEARGDYGNQISSENEFINIFIDSSGYSLGFSSADARQTYSTGTVFLGFEFNRDDVWWIDTINQPQIANAVSDGLVIVTVDLSNDVGNNLSNDYVKVTLQYNGLV